jgi:hypothetical protein
MGLCEIRVWVAVVSEFLEVPDALLEILLTVLKLEPHEILADLIDQARGPWVIELLRHETEDVDCL